MQLISNFITALIAILMTLFNAQLPFMLKLAVIVLLLISVGAHVKSHLIERTKLSSARRANILAAEAKSVLPLSKEVKLELGWSPSEDRPGAFFLYQGGPLSRMFTNPAFKVLDDLDFRINEIEGQIKVSMLVRDESGKLVARLVGNNWEVAPPPKTWDKNYSKDTLEIIGESGHVVLQVRCLPDRIQLNGTFYDELGNGLSITPGKNEYVEIKILDSSSLPAKIDPIFKYPSDKFFGQLIQR
jgi:hypothetical protein